MQSAVNGRFLDQSTSVREAAVELVGRFILIKPELTAQYYTMLANRILVRNLPSIVLQFSCFKNV
jgi:cohesin loading factor subunit SCC2